MPAVAFKLGAVQKQVPLQGIAQEIINFSAKYLK
jgi:chemotaxis response regulator CheB